MAISTMWTNFLNGDTGLSIRNKLNSFNTNILADMVSTEGRITTNEGRLTTAEATIISNLNSITALDVRVTQNESDITALQGPQVDLQLVPQVTPPAHLEGRMYYNDSRSAMRIQGPIPGVEVEVGHMSHAHVINNSGALIEKGSACRHDGVSGGIVQIEKAIADNFVNSVVFGVAQHDIPNLTEGAVITFGELENVDTSGVAVGVPLYLSDTIPGAWTETPPDIVSQLGGALTQDVATGRLFVSIDNNQTLPNVLGILQGQLDTGLGVGVYNVNVVPQNISDYAVDSSVGMTTNATNGTITIPVSGFYDGSFTASLEFASSTSTRVIDIDIYDITTATTLFSFPYNLPRDTLTGGISFSSKFQATAGDEFVMRISSVPNITVTITDIDMDISSVRI